MGWRLRWRGRPCAGARRSRSRCRPRRSCRQKSGSLRVGLAAGAWLSGGHGGRRAAAAGAVAGRWRGRGGGTVKVRLGQVPEAVGLVPALREKVERNLAADRVGELIVGELLLELGHHRLAHLGEARRGTCAEGGGLGACTEGGRRGPTLCSRSNFSKSLRSSRLQLRPMGETLSMPWRNSMNVPRFTGMSRSAK